MVMANMVFHTHNKQLLKLVLPLNNITGNGNEKQHFFAMLNSYKIKNIILFFKLYANYYKIALK